MTEPNRPSARAISESTVLIVGGTAGVGLATAIQFALAGASAIALIGRNTERGQQACAAVRLRAPEVKIIYISADANDPAQAIRAANEAKRGLGRIDVLVNSTVAAFVPRLLHDTPPEDIAPMLLGQMLAPLQMSHDMPCRMPKISQKGQFCRTIGAAELQRFPRVVRHGKWRELQAAHVYRCAIASRVQQAIKIG